MFRFSAAAICTACYFISFVLFDVHGAVSGTQPSLCLPISCLNGVLSCVQAFPSLSFPLVSLLFVSTSRVYPLSVLSPLFSSVWYFVLYLPALFDGQIWGKYCLSAGLTLVPCPSLRSAPVRDLWLTDGDAPATHHTATTRHATPCATHCPIASLLHLQTLPSVLRKAGRRAQTSR